MQSQLEGATIGALGGAGATAGGTVAVLYDGDLLLGFVLAIATGATLAGAGALYFDRWRQ